jgi:hypothetical protein
MPFPLLGAGLGLAGAVGNGLFGGGGRGNPVNGAMDYLNQIPNVAAQNLEPYRQAGPGGNSLASSAYGQMHNLYRDLPDLYQNNFPQEYGQMAQNPVDFLNRIQQSYTPSEGYKYREKRLIDEGRSNAAAAGLSGTMGSREVEGNMLNGILSQDMQQYLQNILGIQSSGLSGQERQLAGRERRQQFGAAGQGEALGRSGAMGENIYNKGYDAAADIANILGSNLGQQGNYAFQGQRQQMANRENRRRNMFDLLGNVGGMAMGGFGGGGNPFFRAR